MNVVAVTVVNAPGGGYDVKAVRKLDDGSLAVVRMGHFVAAGSALANGKEQAAHYGAPLKVASGVRGDQRRDARKAAER